MCWVTSSIGITSPSMTILTTTLKRGERYEKDFSENSTATLFPKQDTSFPKLQGLKKLNRETHLVMTNRYKYTGILDSMNVKRNKSEQKPNRVNITQLNVFLNTLVNWNIFTDFK